MFVHENITIGYAGYSTFALLIGGVIVAILAFSLSFVFQKIKGEKTL